MWRLWRKITSVKIVKPGSEFGAEENEVNPFPRDRVRLDVLEVFGSKGHLKNTQRWKPIKYHGLS